MEYKLVYGRYEITESLSGIRFVMDFDHDIDEYGERYTVSLVDKIYDSDGKEIMECDLPIGLMELVEDSLLDYDEWVDEYDRDFGIESV